MKKYDLVIFGATGFTGKLICDYLLNHKETKQINIAVAARNKNKLEKIVNKFQSNKPDMLIVDSFDKKSSDFVYDRWMQPAWLCPPHTLEFEKIVKQIEKTQHKIWFDSGKKIYLKSNRFEANFLEYIRVYPEYQKYFINLLLGEDSFLSNSFLKKESLKSIIESHISGKNDYHKILILLVSAELTCRIFEKNEINNVNHKFNYFSNLDYIK